MLSLRREPRLSASDHLSNLDQFGSRQYIYPAEVSGRFRDLRNRVYAVLLIVFLALPWIKINGLQAVLIDIPNRRFELFGMLFLAHDTPLLFFLLALAVLAIALSTAVWGRLWCGWACPQTVFIDAVYRRIEIWIEGDYIARRKLAKDPMSFYKLRIYATKWFAYFVVSSLFAHSFIAYFTGSDNLLQMIRHNPNENWSYFVIVTFVTALLLFDFGWFREQFCIIMCPYGRFQSVLMDPQSLVVGYNATRGEPRKSSDVAKEQWGDCVSCNRCVQVCPTGIDIRNGLQMECVACTACIDACDEIMAKVKKPQGLISYQGTLNLKESFLRPRVMAYSLLMHLLASLFAYNLITREPFHITVLRAKDTPYQVLPEDKVLNHFKAHLLNQSRQEAEFTIGLPKEALTQGLTLTQAQATHRLQSGETKEVHFFIVFPKNLLNSKGETSINVKFSDSQSGLIELRKVNGVGPYSAGS